MTKLNFKALMMLGVIMAAPAKADFNSDLSSVQKQWAVVNYELVEDAQLDAFEKLASETAEFTKANDQQAAFPAAPPKIPPAPSTPQCLEHRSPRRFYQRAPP